MSARELDLFDVPQAPLPKRIIRTPDLRIVPPSQPSKSSERGADYIRPLRSPSYRKILACLANLAEGKCLSREEISARTGIRETSMCGRLHELSNINFRIAGSAETTCIETVEDACISSSRIIVTGYRLTAAGKRLFGNGERE